MRYAKKTFDFELKTVTKNTKTEEVVIEGYANTSSKDRVGDVVLPSAFQKSLSTYMNNPVLLVNHDWNDVAGVTQAAEITDKGLYIKARISDTREDLKTLIREGCLRTFSIGYNEIDADMDESTKTKYIKELELLEISVVSVPANTEAMFTTAQVKVEDKPAAAGKDEKALKDFIVMVKDVVGANLGDDAMLNVIDYFNNVKGTQVMTKEELINALKAKSAEAAGSASTEQKQEEAKPMEEAKPAEAKDEMKQMMDAMMQKLDMLGQGMAQMLEMMQKDSQEDEVEQMSAEKPKQEEDMPKADEEQKSVEVASEETKEASQVVETTQEMSADLSEDEIDLELAQIDLQIQQLEDSENI